MSITLLQVFVQSRCLLARLLLCSITLCCRANIKGLLKLKMKITTLNLSLQEEARSPGTPCKLKTAALEKRIWTANTPKRKASQPKEPVQEPDTDPEGHPHKSATSHQPRIVCLMPAQKTQLLVRLGLKGVLYSLAWHPNQAHQTNHMQQHVRNSGSRFEDEMMIHLNQAQVNQTALRDPRPRFPCVDMSDKDNRLEQQTAQLSTHSSSIHRRQTSDKPPLLPNPSTSETEQARPSQTCKKRSTSHCTSDNEESPADMDTPKTDRACYQDQAHCTSLTQPSTKAVLLSRNLMRTPEGGTETVTMIMWFQEESDRGPTARRHFNKASPNHQPGLQKLDNNDIESGSELKDEHINIVYKNSSKIGITEQCPPIKKTLNTTNFSCQTDILLRNMFPDRTEKYKAIAHNALVNQAAQARTYHLCPSNVAHINWLQKGCRYIYPHDYKARPITLYSRILELAVDWIHQKDQIFTDEPFTLPIFIDGLQAAYFRTPKSFGWRIVDKFTSSFPAKLEEKELPTAVVALISTMVFAVIDNHRSNACKCSNFTTNSYSTAYKRNMDILSLLKERSLEVYHVIMHDLFKALWYGARFTL
ncbi:hypothetical protein C8Q73DRAFT_821564 [Cubamyces lactineus]|nr:hypothetical protein C8Q73DRAFT_821564 [Cubamyces lactineus]